MMFLWFFCSHTKVQNKEEAVMVVSPSLCGITAFFSCGAKKISPTCDLTCNDVRLTVNSGNRRWQAHEGQRLANLLFRTSLEMFEHKFQNTREWNGEVFGNRTGFLISTSRVLSQCWVRLELRRNTERHHYIIITASIRVPCLCIPGEHSRLVSNVKLMLKGWSK